MTVCGSCRLSRISASAAPPAINSRDRVARICAILLIMVSPTACSLKFLMSTVSQLLLERLRHSLSLFFGQVLAELDLASMRAQSEHAVPGHRAPLQYHLRPIAVEFAPAQLSAFPPFHQHSIPLDGEALEVRRVPLHVAKRDAEHAH